MDRNIVYEGAIPQDVDILNLNKNLLIGLGFALQAILGGATVVDGLACTPTGPASLNVLLAQGSIYSTENVDATAYGSIGSDTAHQIVKQGITSPLGTLTIPSSGTFAVPSTTGFSVAYLIQGQYQDVDDGSTVLPYYNSSNPAVAYNGPNNTGTSQNTMRQGKFIINVKAGTAATTGTQVTPTPDAGYTGLWVVTIANGTTAITSGMIALYPGAPFINYKLPQLSPSGAGRTALSGNTTYYVSTTGSDSAAGTSGAPWATRQHAVNYLQANVDLAGYAVTIQTVDGSYTDSVIVNGPLTGQTGAASLIFNGDSGTPANVSISTTSHCFYAADGAAFTVQNMEMASSAGNCLYAALGAHILRGPGLIFGGAAAGNHMATVANATIDGNSTYTISGSALAHWSANDTSYIGAFSGTITLTGTPAFGTAFALAADTSTIACYGNTFSGSATGAYFNTASNAVINTNGGGATYLPGNSTGIGTNAGTSPYGLYL
jgi:hypothetical protein